MKLIFKIFLLLIFFSSCEAGVSNKTKKSKNSPTFKHLVSNKGLFFELEDIEYSNKVILPFGEKTHVEIYDHWVVVFYKDGRKFVVNRDQVWSISVR